MNSKKFIEMHTSLNVDALELQDLYHYALAANGESGAFEGEKFTSYGEKASKLAWYRTMQRKGKEMGLQLPVAPYAAMRAIRALAQARGIDAYTGEVCESPAAQQIDEFKVLLEKAHKSGNYPIEWN